MQFMQPYPSKLTAKLRLPCCCCFIYLVAVNKKVAAKVPLVVQDPLGKLRAEAEKHAQAWMELDHVLRPIGFLAAHDTTGTPAVLLTEIAM